MTQDKEQQYFYSDQSAFKVKFWQPAREYHAYDYEEILHPEDGIRKGNKLLEAMESCLLKGELVLGFGEQITDFERDFAEFIGVKHAVMCGSGTQALCLAYASLGIGPGDEVITTSHTFIATIDQIAKLGANPVLVDIGPDGLIDCDQVERRLELDAGSCTPRVKAVVPVHLEGKVCDMGRLKALAEKFKVRLIEDAAQAIGASWEGRKAGSFGDAGCFSFYPAKVLGAVGNAGAMVTDDDAAAQRARMLRCNSNIGKNPDLGAEYGWNLEPDAIQAAVLNVKLKRLPARLAKRREIAERYDAEFSASTPLYLPHRQEGRIYQDYVVRTRTGHERDELKLFLKGAGIKTLGDELIPNHAYRNLKLDFKLPATDGYIATQMRLPLNPDLEEQEIAYIIEKVKSFYG